MSDKNIGQITDKEYQFIEDSLKEVEGVGKQTAAKIISKKDKFSEFKDISKEEISSIGRLSEDKVVQVIDKLQKIDFSEDARILYTRKILRDFLETQYKNLRSLTLGDLDINILLVKALGFTTAEEAIKFNIYQRVTRSTVTSWGSEKGVEGVCLVSGAEKIPKNENVSVKGKKFDIKKDKGSKTYYIQVESGPNTMNIGMVESLNQMIKKIENKHENAVGVLGMTYGKPDSISSQIKGTLKDFKSKSYIGGDFWQLISDKEDFFSDLIDLINEVSVELKDSFDLSFFELVEEKQEGLEEEWKNRYGALGREGLQKFIDQYLD